MPKEQSLDKNLPWAQTSPSSGTHPSGVRLSPPSVSKRFRLLEQLGVGGMGAVYRAYDRELGQELALKQLHSLSSRDRNHLKAEFRALAGIVHPNLVNLYELFVDEHVCFFTMELVRGVDFVQHARGTTAAGPADVAICNVVIDAARQLALALSALHDGGKLHRDVKPSNVLVTAAGRVVLVDFGLTAPLEGSADSNSVAEGFAGTVPYMAPEQVWGEKLGPAADWYAFGVTLFEALLGRLPLSGPPLEVALRKREFVAASLAAEGVPITPAFDQLIVSLLDPEAARRPSASQVIACLGGDVGDRSRASAPPPGQTERFIVGRERELQTLGSVFDAVSAGVTRVVHVTGSSGIGKSTLLREFQRRIEARDRALILRSRCHPQETVAFNAVDGLMDDLSRRLPKLPASVVPALNEEQSSSLLKIFPVLSQCGLGAPGDDRKLAVDGQSSRKNAITGLRELLTAVSRHRPLVLVLDDVQWADRDSGILLRELLRAPSDAALLVLLGYRAEDRASSACLGVLDAAALEDAAPPEPLTLALAPLDSDQSLQLVERRLAEGLRHRALVEPLIAASGGSPFLLCEVANYLNSRNESAAPEELDLGAMLELRTRGLPPEARDVLEVLSVAGAPLGQAVALRAAGLGVEDRGLITNLERLSIVRTTDAHERTTEVYHHRLRDEVLGQMTPAGRVARHRSIASALVTSSKPNPLAAVHHLEAAADTDSLKRYIVSAAHHASQVLAFDRAAELYRRAIEIGASDVEPHELFRRLGTALANAGRGREAGEAFLSAAQTLDRRSDTDPDYVLLLKQKASEQFIQSGHNDLGLRTLKEVLAGLDIHVPGTRRASINRATMLRVYSLFRGVKSKPMPVDEKSVEALRRFDALWAAGIRLSMIDHTFTSYSTIRCALDALAIGEPTRLVCALAGEAGNLAAVPNGVMQRRADALLASTDALLERESMPPYPRCFVRACRAVVAAFRGRHGETVELMDSAINEFRAAAPGFSWETALWQVWLLNALGYVGNLSELRRRAASVLDEARLRDDRFMARSVALGRTTLAWLSEDRPEHTIEQADIALSWAPKEYTTQHYQHYISCAEAELYRGNVDGAWERTVREWPLLTENYFLMLTFLRDELLQIRARSALARARTLDSDAASSADRASARSLRKLALESAGAIQDHGLQSCRGWALLIRATVASQEGRRLASERALRDAVAAFDESGMMLYREAARYRLGETLGDAGADELARANAWLDEQGVLNRPAMIGMLAPGFASRTRA